MPKILNAFRRIDWILFLSVLALTGFGLLAIWTIDLAQDSDHFFNFKKQLAFVGVGIFFTLAGALVDYRALRALARPLYVSGAVLLIAVIAFGATIRGTRGWFEIGTITFQPVELIKVLMVLALAKYLSLKAHIIDLSVLGKVVLIAGIYTGLIFLQPDFGSALVLLAISAGMVLLARVPRRYIVLGLFSILAVSTLLWSFFLQGYQKDRIRSVFNPERDPFVSGYNIRQSVIAVGAGGMWGRGLGEGSQSQLRFLPEAQTDFIFAVLAEQLGFFVVLLIFAAYAVMGWRMVRILHSIADGFAQFCVAGFFIAISTQVILNVGMNLGVLPIVGLPLPFVSLGGSAILSNFLMLGVVQSIAVRG